MVERVLSFNVNRPRVGKLCTEEFGDIMLILPAKGLQVVSFAGSAPGSKAEILAKRVP